MYIITGIRAPIDLLRASRVRYFYLGYYGRKLALTSSGPFGYTPGAITTRAGYFRSAAVERRESNGCQWCHTR